MKSQNKKRTKKVSNLGQLKETYWDYTAKEALKRSGNSEQLKGTIHELAYRDNQNFKLDNILKGKVSKLSKSTVAKSSDVITMKAGKIVSRAQLKDTISNSAIKQTQRKVSSGQYRNSKLIGTEETAQLFNKTAHHSSKKMQSSGISSRTTTRVADNAGVKVRSNNLFKNNLADIGLQSKQSAVLGGVLEMVGESFSSFSDLKDGSKSFGEYTTGIAKKGAKGALVSGTKTASALAIKEGAKAVAKKAGSEMLKKAAGSNAATAIAFGFVEQSRSITKYFRDEIDGSELASETCGNIGSSGGALGGAALFASIGSVVPVIGTGLGIIIGATVFAIAGGRFGSWLGEIFFD
jgi:hypothetical protein